MTKNKIIVAALGLPISLDGKKVLLTERHAPGNPSWHNKWQIAGGGVEFGEKMEDAVVREMFEELHVHAKIIHPYPIVKTSIWYGDESDEGMDTHVILITYLVTIGDQVPDLSHDPDWETAAYGWFTLAEAQKLDCLPLSPRNIIFHPKRSYLYQVHTVLDNRHRMDIGTVNLRCWSHGDKVSEIYFDARQVLHLGYLIEAHQPYDPNYTEISGDTTEEIIARMTMALANYGVIE